MTDADVGDAEAADPAERDEDDAVKTDKQVSVTGASRVTITITTIDDRCATRRLSDRYTRRKKERRAPWTTRSHMKYPGTGSLASGTGQGIKARV